jgi:hypothetical protein
VLGENSTTIAAAGQFTLANQIFLISHLPAKTAKTVKNGQ